MKSFKQFKTIYENVEYYKRLKDIEISKIECVDEGLIKSISYNQFKNHLENLLRRFKTYNHDIKITNHYVELGISLKTDFEEFIKELKKYLNLSGYIISNWKYNSEQNFRNYDIYDVVNNGNLIIRFNKMYDFIDDGIKVKMFHVCNIRSLENILKIGIVPKSKNVIENHEKRIYLFDNLNSAKQYIEVKNFDKDVKDIDDLKYIGKSEDFFIVLEIDMRLITNIKLYKDPKFNESDGDYYTYDNIKPISIKVL